MRHSTAVQYSTLTLHINRYKPLNNKDTLHRFHIMWCFICKFLNIQCFVCKLTVVSAFLARGFFLRAVEEAVLLCTPARAAPTPAPRPCPPPASLAPSSPAPARDLRSLQHARCDAWRGESVTRGGMRA